MKKLDQMPENAPFKCLNNCGTVCYRIRMGDGAYAVSSSGLPLHCTGYASEYTVIEEPRIEFTPYTPPTKTLADVDEWQRAKCVDTSGNDLWMMRIGDQAWYASGDPVRSTVRPSLYTLSDSAPSTPKTLADVPNKVWCLDAFGAVITTRYNRVVVIKGENSGESYPLPCDPSDYPITRVLGYPVLKGVGDE